MVRKSEYRKKDLDLILQAKKWHDKGFIVYVKGSIHCYGCDNTMPLEPSTVNPDLQFFHADNCEFKGKEKSNITPIKLDDEAKFIANEDKFYGLFVYGLVNRRKMQIGQEKDGTFVIYPGADCRVIVAQSPQQIITPGGIHFKGESKITRCEPFPGPIYEGKGKPPGNISESKENDE